MIPILTARNRFLLKSLLLFLIFATIVVYAGRVIEHVRSPVFDLSGKMPSSLSPSTIAYLDGLESPLSITYFVSPRSRMPAHLKHVEDRVTDLLRALRQEAPKWVDVRTIYPEISGEAGANYASHKKVSPFTTKNVHQDEHSEKKVWSSLVISAGGYPEILVQGIKPPDIPYLEEIIFNNLRAAASPPRANIALSAPDGFGTFKRLLRTYGNIQELNLDTMPRIPLKTDILIWIQPSHITEKHISELKRFAASGRSVILAGSPYAVAYESTDGHTVGYRTIRYGSDWASLLQAFGLTPQADLLMDTSNSPIYWSGPDGTPLKVEAPFQIRCMPGFYTLKGFAAPARGALNFIAAGPIQVDLERAKKTGYRARVLGTTTDGAYVRPLPPEGFTNEDLLPELKTGKQNLMVLLEAEDSWGGQLLFFASSSLFRDGIVDQSGHAHRVLLRTLARTYASPERLVRGRIDRSRPSPLPELSGTQRLSLRLFVVVLAPLVLLLFAVHRHQSTNPSNPLSYRPFPAQTFSGFLFITICGILWYSDVGPFLDLTKGGSNSVLPQTRHLLPKSRNRITLQLVITPQSSLPSEMKIVESTIVSRVRELGIPLRIIRPSTLSKMEVSELRQQGMGPFTTQTVRNDSVVSQEIWSGLRVFWGQQTGVIRRIDQRSLVHLEFLLVTTLRRLDTRHTPLVAILSESPRLSPAEAYTDYYQKRLIPPKGADVFSDARELLDEYGYDTSPIDPRNPINTQNPNLLIWFQPRRDASKGIVMLSDHLARGGRAVVALQHFNIQQRQYRGTGFHTVYWPQPQFMDLNHYLKMIGVEQIKEVLMDRTRSDLNLETQINRRAVREYENQQVALPFLIRAVGANFSKADPVVRTLGDQLFIWGNRFSVNPKALEMGLMSVDTLISTTEVSWAFDWKGGWLPEDVFEPSSELLGRQPLAIRLRGKFPAVERDSSGVLVRKSPHTGTVSELILIGCSEMFKNDVLYHPDYAHAQLLLNVVSNSVYGPELTALQSRTRTAKGFVFQTATSKQTWRIIVVFSGPLLLIIYGLNRARIRYKPSTLL
jgi:hypothetical protein